jgi:hypothetical protein
MHVSTGTSLSGAISGFSPRVGIGANGSKWKKKNKERKAGKHGLETAELPFLSQELFHVGG